MFTLEAVQAREGDALIVRYGDEQDPAVVLCDAGPSGVYGNSVKPRLLQLRDARNPDEPLPIVLAMVSHLDDDHIHGMVDLLNDLSEAEDDQEKAPYRIRTLWINQFNDILEDAETELLTAVPSLIGTSPGPTGFHARPEAVAVVASIGQGRDVRDLARKLGLPINAPFEGLVAARGADTVANLDGGLKLTIVGPNQERLERLRKDWDAFLARAAKLAKEEATAQAAAYLDDSVFNLSSIVAVAEFDGKRMLLTGDARGDDILTGLGAAGLLTDGSIHVDLLKVPHHGSDRNVETDFFRRVLADHYVISGNGKHGNPELATLQMVMAARTDDDFELHLTNEEERLSSFFMEQKTAGRMFPVRFRHDDALSIQICLDARPGT